MKPGLIDVGNHDITLDREFYAAHGQSFHNQSPQDSNACLDLIKSYQGITYLNHESTTICLTSEEGPQTIFRVFGSPYSLQKGNWAFQYPEHQGEDLWSRLPQDTDIVITHTPPKSHCDQGEKGASGCEALRRALWRVKPSLAVCGHVHEGRGVERVLWDLSTSPSDCGELESVKWQDPGQGNKKQSLIDLSAKSSNPMCNSRRKSHLQAGADSSARGVDWAAPLPDRGGSNPTMSFDDEMHDASERICRTGTEESCIVNAAIMASSWPYKKGIRYNKPIVVDLDLPVADQPQSS